MSDHDTIPCDYERKPAWKEGEQTIYHDDPSERIKGPDWGVIRMLAICFVFGGAFCVGVLWWCFS